MESDWRYAAWYYTLEVDEPNRFLARLKAPLEGYWLSTVERPNNQHNIYYLDAGMQVMRIAGQWITLEGHPNFPYGAEVYPDTPMQ